MNHIYYQTKTKYTNTGDALINSALINELRKYGVLHANCGAEIPIEFLNALGLHEDERELATGEIFFVKAVVKQAIMSKRNGDRVFVFSGPGDLYGGGRRLVIRNLLSGLVFPIFRLCGVTIVRIGRSVGPISRMMALSEWIRGLFLSYYYVRDTGTLERCHKIGIKKAKLCPDLSWIYHSDHLKRINKTNAVMVNMRTSIFDDIEEGFVESTFNKCRHVLAELNDSVDGGIKIYVAYQVAEDREFCKWIAEQLKQSYDVVFIDHQMQLHELEKYYSKVDYHMSNRMHSLLVGYKYGSLPIALIDTEKHTKIAATFCDCQMEKLMVDIHAPSGVCDLINKRETLMHRLFDYEEQCQKRIQQILSCIFVTGIVQ